MKNIILIGPQGSGKGTQAEKIISEFKLIHLEAGALIRARAKLHDKKAEIIDHLANKKGQLLPDGIVLDMMYEEMTGTKTDTGYLFDGFPRTVTQYQALKEMLSQHGMHLTTAIYLSISDEESLRRLASRRLCTACGKGYSLVFEPEREKCDCGGELIKRADDNENAIRERLNLFHQSTQPILSLMEADKLLIKINGEQPVSKIYEDIQNELYRLHPENI